MLQMLQDFVSALSSGASAVWELEDRLPGRGAGGVNSNASKRKTDAGGMQTGFKWLSASEVVFPAVFNASLRAIAYISWNGSAFIICMCHYLKIKEANWLLVPGILTALPLTMQNYAGTNVVSQPAVISAFFCVLNCLETPT